VDVDGLDGVYDNASAIPNFQILSAHPTLQTDYPLTGIDHHLHFLHFCGEFLGGLRGNQKNCSPNVGRVAHDSEFTSPYRFPMFCTSLLSLSFPGQHKLTGQDDIHCRFILWKRGAGTGMTESFFGPSGDGGAGLETRSCKGAMQGGCLMVWIRQMGGTYFAHLFIVCLLDN
jgi:hypothetical protein